MISLYIRFIGNITNKSLRFTFQGFMYTILLMNIFKAMVPDIVYKRADVIPYETLKSEGKTCILFDFDNTLGPDHATAPDKYAFDIIDKVQKLGFKCCLVSNAKSGRSAGIAQELNIPCVTYAHKPRPVGIYRAMEKMGSSKEETVMIGDQVFTDVIAGKLAGVYTIMVERYSKKEIWYVVLKRPLEKIVRLFARY